MDQDTAADLTANTEDEAEPKRGRVLATLLIRVTLRENVDDSDGDQADIPTNEKAASWVEQVFYEETTYFAPESINATAEKV